MMKNSDTQIRLVQYFNSIAEHWDRWKRRNCYYHKNIERLLQFLVAPQSTVLEVGCATGDLLNAVHPIAGVGVDVSSVMVQLAQKKYPHLTFYEMNAEELSLNQHFDYVVYQISSAI